MKIFKLNKLINNQKIRYLLVGFYNAIFGYLTFVLIFYNFSDVTSHSLLLGIAHFIGVTNNFFTYKRWVFNVKENLLKNYFKFNQVYLLIYIINLILFLFFTKIMNVNLYLAQGLILIVITILGYFMNKNYSFAIKLI
jgi:putative flippase GtrA